MNKELHSKVTPAILPKSFSELKEKLSRVAGFVDWVQIDAVDGVYVPSRTWPYTNDEAGIFTKIVKQDEALPYWEEVNFEVDLMVADPVFEADRWIAAGAMRVVVHINSIKLEAFGPFAKSIKAKGVELVLGYAIDNTIETLASYVNTAEEAFPNHKMIDGIQCMGIDHEGYQKQSFNEKVLQNIRDIKKAYPQVSVSVDGGIKPDTAKKVAEAGASRVIAGSAIFDAESVKDEITELMSAF